MSTTNTRKNIATTLLSTKLMQNLCTWTKRIKIFTGYFKNKYNTGATRNQDLNSQRDLRCK